MIGQLELVPRAPEPDFGKPLLAVRLDGQPQRAKSDAVSIIRGPRKNFDGVVWVRKDMVTATMHPVPGWREWRDAMVEGLILEYRMDPSDERWPITEPVIAGVVAVFRRPQGDKRRYTMKGIERAYPYPWTDERVPFVGRPDADQVEKAGVDVLVRAGLLLDDPLVVGRAGGISRWYAAVGEDPHVEVRLWRA